MSVLDDRDRVLRDFTSRRFGRRHRVAVVVSSVLLFTLSGLELARGIVDGSLDGAGAIVASLIGIGFTAVMYAGMLRDARTLPNALPQVPQGEALRLAPALFDNHLGWLVLDDDHLRFRADVSYRNLNVKLMAISRLRHAREWLNGRSGIRFYVGRRRYFFEVLDAEEWVREITNGR